MHVFYRSKLLLLAVATFLAVGLSGCATESHQVIKTDSVATHLSNYNGPKTTLAVGNFQNRSTYMNGVFSSGADELGSQARTILKTELQKTNRFYVADRANMEALQREAGYNGIKQKISGARYIVTGAITEFGRKVTGDTQLFGILGNGKKQVAYAKATLDVVDVKTSEIVYSTQASGQYDLSNRQIIGFGGTAGYDSTLNGKVLDLVISKAVQNMAKDIDSGKLQLKSQNSK